MSGFDSTVLQVGRGKPGSCTRGTTCWKIRGHSVRACEGCTPNCGGSSSRNANRNWSGSGPIEIRFSFTRTSGVLTQPHDPSSLLSVLKASHQMN